MQVVVVMSTYQGERHVAQQVRSILDQLPDGGQLIVRDDGSTDGTLEQINIFDDPRVSTLSGHNVGFVQSFFILLSKVPAETDIVMLSDQDDIWLPGKIDRAVQHLRNCSGAALYCSRQQLVDDRLQPLALSTPWPRGPSFKNALSENIVTGCTVALNQGARELVLRLGNLNRIHFHDWWMYLVVSAFGTVITDPVPTILYRQHQGNVIGRGAGLRRYLANLRFIRRKSWIHIMFSQIENFREVHGGQLSAEQKQLLDKKFNPKDWMAIVRLLLTPQRFRQTLIDDVLLRALILGEIVIGRGLLPDTIDTSK
ncbi:MAG: glycosyltransferase family 2 protein [Ramlibacter sp.]